MNFRSDKDVGPFVDSAMKIATEIMGRPEGATPIADGLVMLGTVAAAVLARYRLYCPDDEARATMLARMHASIDEILAVIEED